MSCLRPVRTCFSVTCPRLDENDGITPVELQEIIKKFVLAVRKKNGEEYEPSSLRAFIQSIDRHLRKNNYGFSVLNDKESRSARYFKEETKAAEIHRERKPA